MYTRSLNIPNKSFFLFGPRGVGKSTWLKTNFDNAEFIDLLPATNSLRYQKNPSLLSAEIKALPKNKWIVIDEIQKVPELLDEVHHLIENEGYKQFTLSGSSARKLKRGAANMLAGRAITKSLYSLTSQELNFDLDIDSILEHGLLPLFINEPDDSNKRDFLLSYVTTYINEEIKAEGYVRNIGDFSRFLDIAALSAAQQPNISRLARDAGIGRDTVQGYFSIFEDTMLGSFLPAYRRGAKIKEVAKPKFYWFDTGVLNAAAGFFHQPPPSDWKGVLLEHWIYHELKAYMDYSKTKGSLGFWRTPSNTEVDFVWWYGDEMVGIEVKSTSNIRKEHLKGLHSLSEKTDKARKILVYLGDKKLEIDGVSILPVIEFLKLMHNGGIF